VTEREVVQMRLAPEGLYRAFLKRVLPWVAGKSDAPPCAFDELIEPELSALAALQSREEGGREVLLTEISGKTRHDGAAFARGYRALRYPGASASSG
jgi:hypothetical protein